MSPPSERPQVRPLIRWLAIGLAAFYFVVAGALGLAMSTGALPVERRPILIVMSLVAGFGLLRIARIGG